MTNQDLIKLIAVTAELTGQEFSEPAIEFMLEDLSGYPSEQLVHAFKAIRRLGLKLTIGNVIKNIDDGRPGAEEAWSMIPRDELSTTVWTAEMREAYGVASPLLYQGDQIGARMAFKEKYEALMIQAKTQGTPIKWTASLGYDKKGREEVLVQAMQQGKLSPSIVMNFLPEASKATLQLIERHQNQDLTIFTR
jgi:hypothetical protein